MTGKAKRFEVISSKYGNLLGYVYGTDIDHAYTMAVRWYGFDNSFYVLGA